MKKEKFKNIFEESLKNIKVSKELKDKTLNKLYSKNNVYHFPYWIKNCAAIFIVTCICLSIYVINNKTQFNSSSDDSNLNKKPVPQEATFGVIELETRNEVNKFTVKSVKPASDYSTKESVLDETDNLRAYGSVTMDSLETQKSEGLTEKEFLLINPNAEKTNDGYIVIKNSKKIIYVFENGLLIEKNS